MTEQHNPNLPIFTLYKAPNFQQMKKIILKQSLSYIKIHPQFTPLSVSTHPHTGELMLFYAEPTKNEAFVQIAIHIILGEQEISNESPKRYIGSAWTGLDTSSPIMAHVFWNRTTVEIPDA